MATTLPPINHGGMLSAQSPTQDTLTIPMVSASPSLKGTTNLQKKKKVRDVGMEQILEKRLQQKVLSRRETAAYRKTYFHNLCLDILKQGFNKSFIEIFTLIQQQNIRRLQAGPESVLWSQVLLENEPEKLDVLRKYLTQAETAERQKRLEDLYKCQNSLAVFFISTGDKWLSDHYFSQCLETSQGVGPESRALTAEGHCNMAIAQEENGDILAAIENFEIMYELSTGHDWDLNNGQPMHAASCDHLSRVYSTMAAIQEKDEKPEKQLEFLKKAYEMALEGGDRKWTGEASYKLGKAYERAGNQETALHYLKNYLEICRSAEDDTGIAKACEAIGRTFESQGKTEESIKYFEMFLEVAEKLQDDNTISKASSCLGSLFNVLGKYDEAVDFFNRAYNIARSQNNTDTVNSSRVLFGVAAAHKMLDKFGTSVEKNTKQTLEAIVEWKDNRTEVFTAEPTANP